MLHKKHGAGHTLCGDTVTNWPNGLIPQKQRAGWPDWQDAVRQAHEPISLAELSATNPVRERLACDEFFAHQLTLSLARAQQRNAKGRVTQGAGELREGAGGLTL